MKPKLRPVKVLIFLALGLAVVLAPGLCPPARAASEDVAMFYDDLSQYGEWTEYENYGPVWRPSQVPQDWRPYTDGRWVPTNDGYVFESQEPWSWATYHYGNWMPTAGHGWVWVPGRTWYPSTVQWRTSPEDAPVDSSYVGWAPIPPPNYEPPPGYAPASYSSGGSILDLLTAPFWIFAKAASFLLGFGQPYAPDYSYAGSGILVPPAYVPVFYPQTIIVPYYMTPTYYPPGYFGARTIGFGTYCWGPPVTYISRVTTINQTVINQTIAYNSANITRIANVVPPPAVVSRHAYLRQIIPPALAQGQPLPPPRRVENFKLARANLYKPNILPAPSNVPAFRAQIPRLQPVGLQPGRGVPGMALPARATMPLTPQMTEQINRLPRERQLAPARAAAPGAAPPGFQGRPKPHVAAPAKLGPPPGEVPARSQAKPGAPVKPATVQPGVFQPSAPPAPPAKGLTSEQRQRQLELERRRRGGAPAPQPQPGQMQQVTPGPRERQFKEGYRQPVGQQPAASAPRTYPYPPERRQEQRRDRQEAYPQKIQQQQQIRSRMPQEVRAPAPAPRVQPAVQPPAKPQPQAPPPPPSQSRPQYQPRQPGQVQQSSQ